MAPQRAFDAANWDEFVKWTTARWRCRRKCIQLPACWTIRRPWVHRGCKMNSNWFRPLPDWLAHPSPLKEAC